MKHRNPARPFFQWSALALAGAMLFGCGGGGDSAPGATPQAASVMVSESATVLAVRAELPAGTSATHSEMQSLLYTFAAKIESGPNAGMALNGTLVLKGEREDEASTEIEGRFLPDTAPVAAPLANSAELKAQFSASRKALKSALRSDIEALSATLKLALADGAVPVTDEHSAAQKEALATFKTQFRQRMQQYHDALSALVAEYRAATGGVSSAPRSHDGSDDDHDGKGIEVHGTIDANGAVTLTLRLGDKGKLRATGTVAADGSASGTLTGPASEDKGSWSASEAVTVAMPEPKAPVTPPVVTSPVVPPPVATPPVATPPVVTPPVVPPPVVPPPVVPVGDVAAGLARYTADCAGCHTANVKANVMKVTRASTVSALDAAIAKVGDMNGIALTAQQKLDLVAYINSAK